MAFVKIFLEGLTSGHTTPHLFCDSDQLLLVSRGNARNAVPYLRICVLLWLQDNGERDPVADRGADGKLGREEKRQQRGRRREERAEKENSRSPFAIMQPTQAEFCFARYVFLSCNIRTFTLIFSRLSAT